MLTTLDIRNFALIDEAHIHFAPGLNIITGETGAGKSILLGALGLVLGNRADSAVVAGEKCIIEAHFRLKPEVFQTLFENLELEFDEITIIRREIWANGKSRAFVNDSPAPLQSIKKLADDLLDIHAQHEHLLLREQDFRLEVLDIIGENQNLQATFRNCYHRWKTAREEYECLAQKQENLRREKDFTEFQLNEWEELQWQPGELAELEQRRELLAHADLIRQQLELATRSLEDPESGPEIIFRGILHALEKIKNYDPDITREYERLQSAWIEIRDIGHELSRLESRAESDPETLAVTEERLSRFYQFCNKHNIRTEEEALQLAESWRQCLSNMELGNEQLQALEKEINTLFSELEETGATLTSRRKAAAQKLKEQILPHLETLGMKGANFDVVFQQTEKPGPEGWDHVKFLFSANPGMPAGEISKTASGGEISRFILCLKMLVADKKLFPTLLFDEIDTGVSGPVADKMGEMLEKMAAATQIIVITHLPQVASKGNKHLVVKKEFNLNRNFTKILELSHNERVTEIARLLSGEKISSSAIENARNLLGI